jgi:hypothetical protein
MSILQTGLVPSTGGYQIERSLRFNSADSAYLTRTPATASGQNQWTYSCWFKRVSIGTTQYVIGGNTTTSGGTRNEFVVGIDGNDALDVHAFTNASGYYFYRFSSMVFRDLSAWYHLVVQFDPDNGTSNNRVIAYVNGNSTPVSWASSVDSGAAGSIGSSGYRSINNTFRNDIGGGYQGGGAPIYFANQYLTEVHMVSGSLVAYTEFGETDSTTGVWKPKKYAGTYGTNGFYLKFADNSGTTATTLGKDSSGNGNNWTPSGFSVTAGEGNDSLVDTPTPYGSDTGAGGEVRGNYCTWNSATPSLVYNGSVTISNGNLATVDGGTTYGVHAVGTFPMSSGKWYWEIEATSMGGSYGAVGIVLATGPLGSGHSGFNYWNSAYRRSGTDCFSGNGSTTYGNTWTTNDVIGIALDLDAGTLTFYKNGVSQGTAFTGITGTYVAAVGDGQNSTTYTFNANFGQRPFRSWNGSAYVANTAPSGFKALCTANLTTPTIVKGNLHFDTTIYTGNGAVRSITNSGSMRPDFVWDKLRSGANSHRLFDAVRGVEKALYSNLTNAEATETGTLTSFNSDGFSLGTNSETNTNGSTYVAWQWNAGGSTVTNTSGTISAQVRANTTAGFSIATYTGNGTGGATIGHGLGVSPAMIFFKSRSNATNWCVWHQNLTANYAFEGLNTTGAEVSGGSPSKYVRSVSSTLVTIGNDISVNQSASYTYVMYCFAAVAGYSAFGSYTGNGSSNGPFIYTGFRPRWVLVKASSTISQWPLWDAARNPYNVAGDLLYPNLSNAELVSGFDIDMVSNGFKFREAGGAGNDSGVTYIYAAFAENPFKYSLAR